MTSLGLTFLISIRWIIFTPPTSEQPNDPQMQHKPSIHECWLSASTTSIHQNKSFQRIIWLDDLPLAASGFFQLDNDTGLGFSWHGLWTTI